MPRISIRFTKRSHNLIKLLYNARVIQSYLIWEDKSSRLITFSAFHYRNTPYFSHLKIVSTPSKSHHISTKSLKIASKSLGNSIIILETDKGIITHNAALAHKIGGRVLAVIS